jgi:hypothetical protein
MPPGRHHERTAHAERIEREICVHALPLVRIFRLALALFLRSFALVSRRRTNAASVLHIDLDEAGVRRRVGISG